MGSGHIAARFWLFSALSVLLLLAHSAAQDNYEIQVYGSDTVAPGTTMVEFHTNFTASGRREIVDGLEPTNHAVHETLEITQGITPWFETGFYVFTSIHSGNGWEWVGDHIRPRVRVPESWHWPVGVSLSMEVGYQRRKFSTDTWTWEIRPIIDKQYKRWYFAFNPAMERALHGPGVADGFGFAPNAKVSYDLIKWKSGNYAKTATIGLEYYGALGSIPNFDAFALQEHQFFPSLDLDNSPNWELNFGVGVGVTRSTDHLIVKAIVGRRFSWGHARKAQP